MPIACPNCYRDDCKPVDVCALAFLKSLVEERIERSLTPEEIEKIDLNIDMDILWEFFLSLAADKVEELIITNEEEVA